MKIKSFLCALFLVAAVPLFAENQLFNLSVKTDSILLGTSAVVYGTYFVCDKLLNLDKDLPSDAVFDRNSVNGFDRLFMKPYNKKIDVSATFVGGSVCAAGALLALAPKSDWVTIGTMYAETFALAYSLKCMGKFLVGRTRPYMYFDGYPDEAFTDSDWNDSFPSAHSTFAFAAATFTSYTFCKYFPDNPWRFAVIGGTYAVAAVTGGLRVASGNHFVTDVLAGVVIGSACGFVVPYLHTLGFNGSTEVSLGSSTGALGLIPNGLFFSLAL